MLKAFDVGLVDSDLDINMPCWCEPAKADGEDTAKDHPAPTYVVLLGQMNIKKTLLSTFDMLNLANLPTLALLLQW
jgi:hypothetical protein